MDDRAWYINERVQDAYRDAENQRLVKIVLETRYVRFTHRRWLGDKGTFRGVGWIYDQHLWGKLRDMTLGVIPWILSSLKISKPV